MKRAINAVIWLYPKSWRNRYQNEFNALLDDIPPTWRALFNVFGGALKMQMKIWSPWKAVAAFAAAGLLCAIAFSFTVPDRYVSTSIITIENDGPEGVSPIIQRMESRSVLTQLINEQGLYERERTHLPIQDIIEQMKANDIRVATAKSTKGLPAISISFAAGDAARAQRAALGLVQQFMEASIRASHEEDRAAGRTFALYDPPSPAVRVGPRRSRIMLMGVIAGLVAGVLFALFNGLRMWKNAAMLGAAGALLLVAASYLVPERYSSNAVLAYRPTDETRIQQMIGTVTSSANLHALIPSGENKLREHLHVQQIQNSRAILIQFDYPDQRIAQRVTQYVVAQFIKQDWDLEILDPATFPVSPTFPNRSAAAATGLALGLAVATILGIKDRRSENVIMSPS
jgi:uncharacterized protein involved in exopolysaccharide biosynthesis